PTIRDGDMLLVDRSIDRVVDNGIYVVVFGGAVLVKRVHIRRDRSVVLRSENAVYPEEVVPADEVPDLVIEGRVRWFGRTI
ncbi:helix-turn-helix transcriptional regulator, partial [Salmonella enterica]|nr:helix-turn-helix transcriptional regulator [Salmonella enterica]